MKTKTLILDESQLRRLFQDGISTGLDINKHRQSGTKEFLNEFIDDKFKTSINKIKSNFI